MILVDTGPLVALFDPTDQDHSRCHHILASLSEPLYSTEAVLTEVLHMLEPETKGADGIKTFILREYLSLIPLDKVMISRCFELMNKYADLPMDFADATLLCLAETLKTDKVFTLDFQDFNIYKMKKGHRYYPLSIVGYELFH